MTFFGNILPSVPPILTSRLEPLPPSTLKVRTHAKTTPSSASRVVDGLLYLRDGLTKRERDARRYRHERSQLLRARMQGAEAASQWDAAAHELDIIEGNEKWKADRYAGDYNPEIIEMRLRELDDARKNDDVRAMLHLVRTALSRDLGGMGNIDLYRHSYCGTKKLIERYVDSALQTITVLVERSANYHGLPDKLEPRDLLDAILYARQSFGRSALLLSGGGTFGMTHIGVIKALFEAKLLPRIISGASAGSIVCSVVCVKTDDELPQVIRDFPHGDLAVFEEQGNEDGLLDHLRRLLTDGNWSDIRHLTRVMRELLGDITFQEAYNRTRRICNICVSTASIYELPRLLNYVTAPNVMIWSAVAASCSVPIVFSAGALLVKNPLTGEHSPWNPTPQMWIDGSVDNDLPMTRLSEMFNVNHFIVSQVNPHVVPFLAKDDTLSPCVNNRGSVSYMQESDWLYTATSLALSEALHRMQTLAELGVFPNLVSKLRSILSQKYSGDITILPAIGVFDLPNILKNPTTEFMSRSCLLGERATWPKVSRIRDCCAIELALDRAVHALRARVVFSKSQVDLRRMATGSLAIQKRRSHEPIIPTTTRTGSAPSKEKFRHRNRRSSGSSLHRPDSNPTYTSPRQAADDDSGGEERHDITMRYSRRKPKLKLPKLPKHHALPSGPLTGPAIPYTAGTNSFEFPRPLVLSARLNHASSSSFPFDKAATTKSHSPHHSLAFDNGTAHISESGSMTSPLTAPTKEAGYGTSDSHSSDGAVQGHTDCDATDSAVRSSHLGDGEA